MTIKPGKRLRYKLEVLLVKAFYTLVQILPVRVASAIGGKLATVLGRISPRSGIARRNLQRAIPELESGQINEIIRQMWDNLGRTFAEFPHIARLPRQEISRIASLEGERNIFDSAGSPHGTIFFTGHLANWEITPRVFSDLGYPLSIVYRKGNNPGLARIIQKLRASYLAGAIPKGQEGSRHIIRHLKRSGRIGMLVDQKMNDGIRASFFDQDAMTAPAIARLALKYDCPVYPVRVIRLNGCKFRVEVSPAIDILRTGDTENDVVEIINQINSILEGWIRENPGQWIWLHNRWSGKD